MMSLMRPGTMLGGELSFFTPRYSFLARKKLMVMGHYSKYRDVPEKQGKVCGQTKIAIVALSPSKNEDTSTGPIQRRTRSLSITHELVLTPLSWPFFPHWEGQDESVSLKKPVWPRNHVRTSTKDLFCSANYSGQSHQSQLACLVLPSFCYLLFWQVTEQITNKEKRVQVRVV